jgi:MoxR-like ATPase
MTATETREYTASKYGGTCWTCGRAYPEGSHILSIHDGYTYPPGHSKAGKRVNVYAHKACGLPAVPVHPSASEERSSVPAPAPFAAPLATPTLPLTTPQPRSAPVAAPAASSALDMLAAELQARLGPQRASIDPDEVRRIAEELDTPLVSRLAAVEARPQYDAAALELHARRAAYDEARAALVEVNARAKGGPVALVGEIPTPDALYHDASDTSAEIRAMLARHSHALVSGPSGSGKTYPILQECARAGRRAVLVSCADGITYSALACRPSQTTPSLEYRYGPLPLAMKSGAVLVLDECDKLDPLLAALFHAPLEPDTTRRTLYLPETGETITAAPGFQIIGTCNGLRDESGSYSSHRIDAAFLTRCRGIAADYLSQSEEAALFERAGLDAARSRKLAETLAHLRREHLRGNLTIPPSTRLGVQWLRMVLGRDDAGRAGVDAIPPKTAWRLGILNLLTPGQATNAATIIKPDDAGWKVGAP